MSWNFIFICFLWTSKLAVAMLGACWWPSVKFWSPALNFEGHWQPERHNFELCVYCRATQRKYSLCLLTGDQHCYILKTVSLTFGLVFSRHLFDIPKREQLNSKQFAWTMDCLNEMFVGVDPPLTLSPYMVPPSMRTSSAGTQGATGEVMVGN